MCAQPSLPLQPASLGVFRQYELGGLGCGAAAGPRLLQAPVLGWIGCPGCAMARGGPYPPRAWCRHTVVWAQCRAGKRPAWRPCQLAAGRKWSNQEGKFGPYADRRHSHCVNNAVVASESFRFTSSQA